MNLIYKLLRPFSPIIGKFPEAVFAFRLSKDLGRKINAKTPVSLYDKIYWLSFNTDTKLWSKLADKYGVREYVAAKCGETVLTKLYGVYDSVNEIDYSVLPNDFVIKTNNGCASNFLIRNKSSVDLNAISKELNFWLKFPYGELTGQKHYTRIPPKILAEELLYQKSNPNATLVDYKFFCFHGVPMYCEVISDRVFGTHIHNKMMYDMEWNAKPEAFNPDCPTALIEKPTTFEDMKEMASILSKDFKFVRVDLYEVNGEIKFGEMTFTPTTHSFTDSFQLELGGYIQL